jgi:hypothetical protein
MDEPFRLEGIACVIAPGQNGWQLFFVGDVVDDHFYSFRQNYSSKKQALWFLAW